MRWREERKIEREMEIERWREKNRDEDGVREMERGT